MAFMEYIDSDMGFAKRAIYHRDDDCPAYNESNKTGETDDMGNTPPAMVEVIVWHAEDSIANIGIIPMSKCETCMC